MDKVIITGGTGFIGLSLAKHLKERGFTPVLVARSKPKQVTEFEFVEWDGVKVGDWAGSLDGAKAIVNLAGKSVDCIKTPDNCDLILRSRLETTRTIGHALSTIENSPKIWIQMSTAHIYGDPPVQVCTESSPTGYGLAPFVGKAWEKALLDSKPEHVREVRLRTSFVVGKNGGALSTQKKITKLGLGGKVGNGKQGISWIHEFDMNEIIHQAILNDSYEGVYIASAPNPVSNKEYMKTLRKTMGIPFGLPAPEFITRFGAKVLFNTDPELAIYGRYVIPQRLLDEGFSFRFPDLESAFSDLF